MLENARHAACLVVLLALTARAAFAALAEEPPHPKKIALLVGIDEYAPGTPLGRLAGCVRDVRLVQNVLEERFGFAHEDVTVLTNAEATHQGIVESFVRSLIARAGADTEVVFWFSGHGSRTPDASGKAGPEMDGKDETLVAYDSRTNGADGARDVSDDEIGSLLLALAAKTSRVLVVTDSCHSGGVTRGVVRGSRSAAEGTRPVDLDALRKSFWPKDVPLYDDGDRPPFEAKNRVHIAACSPRETAQEIEIVEGDGPPVSHGALTFYLVACLTQARPDATYRSIADLAAVRLAANGCAQTPWYDGPLDRTLFAGQFAPAPEGFLARAAGAPGAPGAGKLAVEGGTFSGLRAGSVLEIRERTSSKRLGTARVERTAALTCTATWTSEGAIPPGALSAIEMSRPAGVEPLPLEIEDAALRAKLATFELARLVSPDSPSTRGPGGTGATSYVVAREGERGFALFARGGTADLRLWRGEAVEGGVDRLALGIQEALRKEVGYRALLALAAETGTIAIEAAFVAPTADELGGVRDRKLSPRCEDAHVRTGHSAGRAFQATGSENMGELLRLAELEVRNTSDFDVHIAVLSISEDRARNLIHQELDRVLRKGASIRIPVSVTLPPIWPKDVPMHDRYLVLATREPADLSPYVAQSQLRGEEDERVPGIVRRALMGPETRGVKNLSSERASYGIATCELLVER